MASLYAGGGRLDFLDATHLKFAASPDTPGASDKLYVNGEDVPVTVAGIQVAIADHLIDGNGDDTGAGPLGNQDLYCYRSNSKATTFPNQLRLSASPPNFNDDSHELLSLGLVGNQLNWRFVGWARTDAVPNFYRDFLLLDGVCSFLNPRPAVLVENPGFVNNNADTTYALPVSAAFATLPGSNAFNVIAHTFFDVVHEFIALVTAGVGGARFTSLLIQDGAPGVFTNGASVVAAAIQESARVLSILAAAFNYNLNQVKYQPHYKSPVAGSTAFADVADPGGDLPATYHQIRYYH